MTDIKPVCGNCILCEKDDGSPYCVLKDLYTTVGLEDECNERDLRGNLMFAAEKKDG